MTTKTMSKITREQAVQMMKSGRFFTAHFIKRDGTLRKLNGRCGVSFAVTGKGMRYKAEDKNIIIVRDVKKKAYRAIKIDSLLGINHHEII
jgi:hypothetical protein